MIVLYDILEQEYVNFAKAAKGYAKLLGSEIVKPEIWRERHENFDNQRNVKYVCLKYDLGEYVPMYTKV